MAGIEMNLPRNKDYFVRLQVSDPDEVRLECGDITKSPAEAIVNAANSELLAGGGVCGAIYRAAGPAIADDCRRINLERGPILPGQAVATTAGDLPAKYVIHAVGPVWQGGSEGEAEDLASCYRESMRIADELGLHSIAFPAISTGIFGYPVEQAAWVAVPTVVDSLRKAKNLLLVYLVLFDKATLDTFARIALAQPKPDSGNPYAVSIGEMHA